MEPLQPDQGGNPVWSSRSDCCHPKQIDPKPDLIAADSHRPTPHCPSPGHLPHTHSLQPRGTLLTADPQGDGGGQEGQAGCQQEQGKELHIAPGICKRPGTVRSVPAPTAPVVPTPLASTTDWGIQFLLDTGPGPWLPLMNGLLRNWQGRAKSFWESILGNPRPVTPPHHPALLTSGSTKVRRGWEVTRPSLHTHPRPSCPSATSG